MPYKKNKGASVIFVAQSIYAYAHLAIYRSSHSSYCSYPFGGCCESDTLSESV